MLKYSLWQYDLNPPFSGSLHSLVKGSVTLSSKWKNSFFSIVDIMDSLCMRRGLIVARSRKGFRAFYLSIFILISTLFFLFTNTSESLAMDVSLEPPSVILSPDGQALIDNCALLWRDEGSVLFIDNLRNLNRWVIGSSSVETVQFDIFTDLRDGINPEQLRAEKLFVAENALFAFSATEGAFYSYASNGWGILTRFDLGDPSLSELSLNSAGDFVVDGERIYFTARANDGSELLRIVSVDLLNGECAVLALKNVQAIAQYRPGYLLAQIDGVINDLRIEDEQVIGEVVISADPPSTMVFAANPVTFAYDPQLDQIIYMKNGNLYVQRGNTPSVPLRALPKLYGSYDEYDKEPYPLYPASISQLLPLSGDLIAINLGKVYIASYAPLSREIQSLRVSLRTYDADLFSLTHPHVSVEEWCCFDKDAVDPRQRSNPKYPLDVYETSTDDGLAFLLRNGYALDVTNVAGARSKIGTFYPQVQEALSYDGRVMAVPTQMYVNLWTYQADLWEMLGLPDPPKTFEAFWELYELWSAKYAKIYPGVSFTGSYSDGVLETMVIPVRDQYIFEHATGKAPVNFDTPEFRLLLERMRELPNVEMSSAAPYLNPLISYSQDSRNHFFDLEYMGSDGYMPLVPPMLPGQSEPRIGAVLYALYAGNDAPNPALAQEFLSFAAEHPRRGLSIMLSPSENEPLPLPSGTFERIWQDYEYELTTDSHIRAGDEHQQLMDHLYTVASLQRKPYVVSPEMIAFYRELAPFITFQTDALGGNNRMERTYEIFSLLFKKHLLETSSGDTKFGDDLFSTVPIEQSIAADLCHKPVTDEEALIAFLDAAAAGYFEMLH